MLKLYLEQYDALDKSIAEIDRAVDYAITVMDQEEAVTRKRQSFPVFHSAE
jgi:hypothetical protein